MRILLTNLILTSRTGTEIVIRDLALGLAAAGHTPSVFTPAPGPIAQELRDAGVVVVDDLSQLSEVPDVIHGHHHVETTLAMLRFPETPAIFVCHDRLSPQDLPPQSDQIRRYVAVDRNCLERFTEEAGVPLDKTCIIHNAIDTRRFPLPGKLPEQPRRALIFSNYAGRLTHMEPVMNACSTLGLPVDVIGSGVQASADAPEQLLRKYDLVFAKARCALEAMAAGTAVVLCDRTGLGPMVTMAQVASLRDWNFGRRCLQQRLTSGAIAGEVMKYNAGDAQAVSSWVRETATLDAAIKAYLRLYQEVIEEARRFPFQVKIEPILRNVIARSGALQSRLKAAGIARTMPLPPACTQQVRLKALEPVRSMDAGAVVNLFTEIENTSTETLSSAEPYPVCLAYHWIDSVSQQTVVVDGHRTVLSADVAPQQRHRQAQLVEAPSRAGTYILRLTLVQEYVFWFDVVNPAAATDLLVSVRGTDESNVPADTTGLDLQSAIAWVEGLTLVRNGRFSNAGFVSSPSAAMLTFVESPRFARELNGSPHVSCVLTTPDIAAMLPEDIGVAVCGNPRAAFVDLHNHLAEATSFYWKEFPTVVDPSARIHPSVEIPAFNVVVGARSVIDAHVVIGEKVLIGEECVIQPGTFLGAEGFQTDRSGDRFCEMTHAGAVRLEAGVKVFAGAVVARGVFREFTHIGRQARIGNRAFLSHNVEVGTRVFVGHGAVVNGNVKIGDRTWIGPGSTIANNVAIGPDAHVGLGSTVIRDVPADSRVIGATAVKSDRMFRFTASLEK